MDTTPSTKSFWNRPEGTTGMIALFTALAGLGWVTVTTILPFLLALVWTGLELTVAGTALFVLLFMLSDRKNWARAWAAYQVAMHWSTSWIIELDPIAIMEGYVDDLKDKLATFTDRITTVRGEMRALKEKIAANAGAADKAIHVAGTAKQEHKQELFLLQSRQAGRLTNSNRTLQQLYDNLDRVHTYLTKARSNTDFMIQDLAAEVADKRDQRKYIRSAYSAISAARSVIDGDKNKRALFEEALEIQARDYGEKLGQIDEIMDVSANFLDSLDIQNGIYEEQALKQLEDWEHHSAPLLLADQSATLPDTPGRVAAYANLYTSKTER